MMEAERGLGNITEKKFARYPLYDGPGYLYLLRIA